MIKEISAIALLTLKEGLRHRIIYGIIIFSILAITFNVIISGYFLRDIQKILVELSLSVVSLAGLTVPFFSQFLLYLEIWNDEVRIRYLHPPFKRTIYFREIFRIKHY